MKSRAFIYFIYGIGAGALLRGAGFARNGPVANKTTGTKAAFTAFGIDGVVLQCWTAAVQLAAVFQYLHRVFFQL